MKKAPGDRVTILSAAGSTLNIMPWLPVRWPHPTRSGSALSRLVFLGPLLALSGPTCSMAQLSRHLSLRSDWGIAIL